MKPINQYKIPSSKTLALAILNKLAAEKRRLEGLREMDAIEAKRLNRIREARKLLGR